MCSKFFHEETFFKSEERVQVLPYFCGIWPIDGLVSPEKHVTSFFKQGFLMKKITGLFLYFFAVAALAQSQTSTLALPSSTTELSKWGLSYFGISVMNQKMFQGQETASSWTRSTLSLSRKSESGWSFGTAANVIYISKGNTLDKGPVDNSSATMDDWTLSAVNFGFLQLSNDTKYGGVFLYHLPTSESSVQQSSNGNFQAKTKLEKTYSSFFKFGYYLNPRYYFQTKGSYLKEIPMGPTMTMKKAIATKLGEIDHGLSFTETMGSISLHQDFGLLSEFSNGDLAAGLVKKQKDSFKLGLAARYTLVPGNWLTLSVENKVALRDNAEGFGLFRRGDTSLALLLLISI